MSDLVYVGIDDTDMPDTRGTNRLALAMVQQLAGKYRCVSVSKHPHLQHERIPYTHGNNSCVMVFQGPLDLDEVAGDIRALMQGDFIEGSDPGLCVTDRVPVAIQDFGDLTREVVVTQEHARELAAIHGIHLEGLGGTELGVIGALAGVGTLARGQIGCFLQLGDVPLDFGGELAPATLDQLGVTVVHAETGELLQPLPLVVPKKLRPAIRNGRAVAYARPGVHGLLDFVRRD